MCRKSLFKFIFVIFGAYFVLGQSAHAIEKVAREKTLVVTPWSDTTGPLKMRKIGIFIRLETKISVR